MPTRSYDPTENKLVFKGLTIASYAPDSFIKAARNTKSVTLEVGASGDVVRVFSKDKSGKLTVSVLAASSTNDKLSAIQQSDEANADGLGALQLNSNNGTLFVHGDEACIEGPPEINRGAKMPTYDWVFLIANMDVFAGGSLS